MFAKIFTFLALVAVAFAAPKPAPAPQVFTYSTGLDYVYPAGIPSPAVVSPYAAASLAYPALPNAYYYR